MCNKCGIKHGRFKNGRMKKTCPTKRRKRTQKGDGLVEDINMYLGKHIVNGAKWGAKKMWENAKKKNKRKR